MSLLEEVDIIDQKILINSIVEDIHNNKDFDYKFLKYCISKDIPEQYFFDGYVKNKRYEIYQFFYNNNIPINDYSSLKNLKYYEQDEVVIKFYINLVCQSLYCIYSQISK